jgi:hypothetical protein
MSLPATSCKFCSSPELVRNGSNQGRAKYRCKSCGRTGYFDDRLTPRLQRYAQVEKLLAERLSLRAIVRATGVSRMTVAKPQRRTALKKKPAFCPHRCLKRTRRWNSMSCTRSSIIKATRSGCGWLYVAGRAAYWPAAADRFHLGDRRDTDAWMLYRNLPEPVQQTAQFFSDRYGAYTAVFPKDRHHCRGKITNHAVRRCGRAFQQRPASACGPLGPANPFLCQIH